MKPLCHQPLSFIAVTNIAEFTKENSEIPSTIDHDNKLIVSFGRLLCISLWKWNHVLFTYLGDSDRNRKMDREQNPCVCWLTFQKTARAEAAPGQSRVSRGGQASRLFNILLLPKHVSWGWVGNCTASIQTRTLVPMSALRCFDPLHNIVPLCLFSRLNYLELRIKKSDNIVKTIFILIYLRKRERERSRSH